MTTAVIRSPDGVTHAAKRGLTLRFVTQCDWTTLITTFDEVREWGPNDVFEGVVDCMTCIIKDAR